MSKIKKLCFSGALNYETIISKSVELKQAQLHMQDTSLEINLSAVTRCDSAGLALLIEAKRWACIHKKNLIISGMPEPIEALAEFCGVLTVLMVD